MLKVKSSMDQFIEGLQELQIIDLIKQYPEKMKSLFVATSGCLTTEGLTSCTIEDVLIFFTGTDRIPPSGFDKEPTIHFIHDESAKFCTASTCDIQLCLPTKYDVYGDFHEAMITSLLENGGV